MNNDKLNDFLSKKTPIDSMQTTSVNQYDDNNTPQLLAEPRRVAAGMGMRWISHAWEIFKARWGMWLGMALVMNLILGVVQELSVLASVLMFFFCGGVMLSCDALVEGDELEFNYLFAGFKFKFVELLKLALISLVLIIVMVMIAVVVILLSIGMSLDSIQNLGNDISTMTALIAIAIMLICMLPVAMMTWFAPAIICLHDIPAWQAMKMSWLASKNNVLPLIVCSVSITLISALVGAGIGIVIFWFLSLMPFALLLMLPFPLVLTILTMIIGYTSYRSIWTTPTLED